MTAETLRAPFPVQDASVLLAAMANPVRFHVMELLLEKEWDVTSLSKRVGLSQSALSQHLKILRRANLVQTRKEAHFVYYSSKSRKAKTVIEAIYQISATNSQTTRPRRGPKRKSTKPRTIRS